MDSSKKLSKILASKNFQLGSIKSGNKKINGVHLHPHSLICYPTNSNIKLNLESIPRNLLYSQKIKSQSLEAIRETGEKIQISKRKTMSKTFREEERRKISTSFWVKNSMKSQYKNHYRWLNQKSFD